MANVLSGLITVVVSVAAYLYYKHTSEQKRIEAVLDGLKLTEKEAPLEGTPRVAVGFEATIDYIVDALELFEVMNLEPPEKAKPHDILRNEGEFMETFAFFFNHSAASS